MISGYNDFKKYSDNKKIKMTNKRFDITIQNINFLQISSLSDLSSQIINKIKQSNLIVIDNFTDDNFDIFCCDEYLIIIQKTNISIFKKLISISGFSECFFYWIPDLQKQASALKKYSFLKFEEYYDFIEEINEFIPNFQICYIYQKSISQFWKIVSKCIAGYLIKKAYTFCINKRHNIYVSLDIEYIKKDIFNENDFVTLRLIGTSEMSRVYLGYYIENCQLVAIKKLNSFRENDLNAQRREINNYKRIHYPFLPKYYGIIENDDDKDNISIVTEFIYGKNLQNISKMFLNLNVKMKNIIQILFTFQYLHKNKFIYRDLKPNNIIIDKNNDIVLIDFDRMLNEDEIKEKKCTDFTREFTAFSYPEFDNLDYKPSYNCDIYSIGMIIKYFLTEKFPSFDDQIENKEIETEYPFIYKYLYKKCINVKNENTKISDLINNLKNISCQENSYEFSKSTIQNIGELIFSYEKLDQEIQNVPQLQYIIGLFWYDGKSVPKNINKAIHYFKMSAKNNCPDALCILGIFYLNGEYFQQNTNKAIEYLTKASDLNHSLSQRVLGENYIIGNVFQKDINKGIKYLELSSKDSPLSQYHLGTIYISKKYDNYNVDKAIYYFTMAANNNFCEAQNALGIIYRDGIHCKRDIQKSIYHFSLGVEGNSKEAEYNLGVIYLEGKYVKQDVDKAIHLFTLAANQNHPSSLYNLGCIYGGEIFSYKDIKKSLHFYQMAANFNHTFAQYQIGLIYYQGDGVKKDINIAIKYFMLSANNNDVRSLYFLGKIYSKDKYHLKNIDKAIHYFTIAVGKIHSVFFSYFDKMNIKGNIYENKFKYELRNNLNANLFEQKSLFHLGKIYLTEKLSEDDKNKGIYYLKLAAKNNNIKSQILLFEIYYHGLYTAKDVDLAIYYLQMAEKQKNPLAQYLFGMYYFHKNDYHEKEKSIYYFESSANQNFSDALYTLGILYHEGIIVHKDINKAIDFYLRAAKKNNSNALHKLGLIYFYGENGQSDINKSINYLSQSAKLNNIDAEYSLGVIYLTNSSINKGLFYINKSANNHHWQAKLLLGDFYLAGILLEKNIEKAIALYKEVSNINNSHAKNNLGVIYKVGTDKINANIYHAKEYLKEAICNKNDFVAKYNLATILYKEEEKSKSNHKESIKLIIESSNQKFIYSHILLCFILFKIYGKIDFEIINNELKKYSTSESSKLAELILTNFSLYGLFIMMNGNIKIDDFIKSYLNKNFIFIGESIFPYDFKFFLNGTNSKQENINSEFYQGFGQDLIQKA